MADEIERLLRIQAAPRYFFSPQRSVVEAKSRAHAEKLAEVGWPELTADEAAYLQRHMKRYAEPEDELSYFQTNPPGPVTRPPMLDPWDFLKREIGPNVVPGLQTRGDRQLFEQNRYRTNPTALDRARYQEWLALKERGAAPRTYDEWLAVTKHLRPRPR